MMDHETPPRISLLDRLVKAFRSSPSSAMSSPEMADQATMGEDPSGTMAGASSMSDHVAMGTPSMATPLMAEPAMEPTAMGEPAPVDESSMG